MKAGSEHRIPLSDPALAVLKQMMPLATGKDALVFSEHTHKNNAERHDTICACPGDE